jgi:RNA-directed DNA polymerase
MLDRTNPIFSSFLELQTRQGLSRLLGVTNAELVRMLYKGNLSRSYTSFTIAKKSGDNRTIDAPKLWLKKVQKDLLRILSSGFKPKASASAYSSNRGIVYNAKRHVKRRFVFNVDLRDFFPSINFGRVRGMFIAEPFGLSPVVATVVAQICCFNNRLPQGAPTSPIISNMICSQLDAQLLRLARRTRCQYTRYADDISFSTYAHVFPSSVANVTYHDGSMVASVSDLLRGIIEQNGFEVNDDKVRIQSRATRQQVTGLVVNEKLNVRRSYIKNVRAMLNALEKHGYDAEAMYQCKYVKTSRRSNREAGTLVDHLKGKIEYIKQVKGKYDPVYEKLQHRLNVYLGKPSFLFTDKREKLSACLWVIEWMQDVPGDDVELNQGTGFMVEGVGLVTCSHVIVRLPPSFGPLIGLFKVEPGVRVCASEEAGRHSRCGA